MKYSRQALGTARIYMNRFADLVERLDGIEEADGSTLLDNTTLTYGFGLGDGAMHLYNDPPIVVAGSGVGNLKLGQHLTVPRGLHSPTCGLGRPGSWALISIVSRIAPGLLPNCLLDNHRPGRALRSALGLALFQGYISDPANPP